MTVAGTRAGGPGRKKSPSSGQPIPKVAALSQEYAELLAKKQAEYERYKAARQDMITYRNAKQNVDRIFGLQPHDQDQEKERKTR